MNVRKVYDVLAEDGEDVTTAREFLLFQVSLQVHRDLISKQHLELVTQLLPKPPARRRGRPKDARGKDTYGKKRKLYLDWIYERTIDPSLTKEQFAKKRLGITDEQYKNDNSDHARVHAFLQDLKPARMKYLDEDERRAIDVLYPIVLTQSREKLARKWREAKQNRPALTKEEFVRDDLDWMNCEITENLIRQQLE